MLFPSHFPRPITQIDPNLQRKEEYAAQYTQNTHIIHTQKKHTYLLTIFSFTFYITKLLVVLKKI